MIIFTLVILVILFCFSAFFSSSESALFSLDPIQVHRIRKTHPKSADRLDKALSTPTKLLSAILIGNTLVNVAASSIGYGVVEHLLPNEGVVVAIPVMTVLLLIFGEISPKCLALRIPEKLSIYFVIPLDFFTRLMAPATMTLSWIVKKLDRWMSPSPKLTEDEFRTALHEGEKDGLLDKEERSIVEGIIRLEGLTAGDVMTPRIDLVFIDVDDDPNNIAKIARNAKFKNLPVYRETTDQIQGFLDVRCFLLADAKNLEDALTPPMFVPLSTPLDKLMVMLQNRKRRIACVVDEFGGTAGIVTKGDVMEEIIYDENESIGKTKTGIERLGVNRWLVGGDTSLEEINSKLDLDLEAEGAIRISGWVAVHLERIPRRGDVVDSQNCRVIIRNVRERRITSVVLETNKGAWGI